jgi:HK97 family phage major capsid protein/HK97 family phage prohead protease
MAEDNKDAVRWNDQEPFRREVTADIKADEKNRTVELCFSSELAVQRYDWRKDKEYNEILSHNPEDVDLSRLNNAHPLLLNHDSYNQIGVVESARVDSDKKCRAVVRFSKSQTGEEIWQDVKDGIRRLVSVGYRRLKEVASEAKDGVETVRFSWLPYEVSIVSIPADPGVGIGRSQQISTRSEPKKSEKPMAEDAKPLVTEGRDNRVAKDIMKIAKTLGSRVKDINELASTAIDQDWSVERFQSEALNRLPEAKPMDKPLAAAVPQRDWEKYSITRAICGQINGRMDGLEKEVSDECARTIGGAQGLWVPPQAMARTWNATTGANGGMLISTPNDGDSFISLLRKRCKVLELGARQLTLNGPVTIPRQSSAGTANVVAESVAATLSTGAMQQITLSPIAVSAFEQYSKQLLFTSNPSIDQLVRDDIMNIIAIEIDRLCLHSASSPTGIAATSGIGAVALGADAGVFTSANAWPAIVSLETEVAIDNADVSTCAYLTNAKVRGKLKVVDKSAAANTAQWVWGSDNTLNGYRAEVSNQVSSILTKGTATTICSAIFFGNFADLIVAQFNGGATDLVIDPYVLAVNGVVRVIARHWIDIGVRHPESFSLLADAIV